MNKTNYEIPFDENGNQLSYPATWMNGYQNKDVIFKDNFIFEDTLCFVEFQRGRSSAIAKFHRSSTNTYCTVFLSDLAEIIKNMKYGNIQGTFTFCKKGQNYGLKLEDGK